METNNLPELPDYPGGPVKSITQADLRKLLDEEFGYAQVRPISRTDALAWLDYFYGGLAPELVD